jgi:competence protein ComEA
LELKKLTITHFSLETKASLISKAGWFMKKLMIVLALFSVNSFASPVNINKADAKTIADSLSGIGMAKAEAIVAYRTAHGDFKTTDDLDKVSGIGAKTIEKNKADILFDASPAIPVQPVTPAAKPASK